MRCRASDQTHTPHPDSHVRPGADEEGPTEGVDRRRAHENHSAGMKGVHLIVRSVRNIEQLASLLNDCDRGPVLEWD